MVLYQVSTPSRLAMLPATARRRGGQRCSGSVPCRMPSTYPLRTILLMKKMSVVTGLCVVTLSVALSGCSSKTESLRRVGVR